ncbi:tripartite tricarboxylate transporter permease [Pantoea allii]|uniref:tripartite tricarboxylate transporter permease n=1 Tax=Pantoea TaxID=53335 RepID=UPI0011A446E3|nr:MULTISPECIES: tripartite tricarboxylate transporter permease [Pantoea]MCH9298221.1 tripartite tricarboxylate transporter permease [Pantoea allii]MDJ0037680.1 tripartite tricarboxylate transporter permease [Pantoea allii]MDJ0089552.1 tripartite tricarboxylate transporter permease [Pantoea allii]NQS88077.1 tripartite tricarboxylate transporter permease [Pantoea allii]TWD40650.1 putative tricarboxylic transport membrane protein [Pantoea sp. SJZ147]
METWSFLMHGFAVAMTPENLLIALIGCFIGTIVGLLPGLGPINGVAILMPLAFALHLPAESALILLATVYLGCEYGGRISSILLNVPGDAGAIMTALDGYPMAQQGKAGVALSISAVSSFVGSTIAILGIILFAPLLARWSLAFGPAEYFALMVFAIACLGSMMSQNPLKSFLSALIGLSMATVGVDANTGVYRFTFDSVHLSDGIQFVVVVIGLFSVSEILLMLESTHSGQKVVRASGRMMFNMKEAAMSTGATLRASFIGFFVGVLPGAGATIASAIAYMAEKKISGSDQFGKGDIRGVAAPEAANNASACGSFIPMLTLGIPGSGTTAVMVGALTLYNITPGPAMFTEQPDIVWGLIAALLIGNLMLLIMNIPMINVFARMLTIPLWFLVPAIAAISAVGVYAVHSTTFDLLLMVGLGIFGYILRKMDFPMSPLILGFVLGEMLEQNLRRALSISNGEMAILWESPIAKVLLILAVAVLIVPLVWKRLRRKPAPVHQ